MSYTARERHIQGRRERECRACKGWFILAKFGKRHAVCKMCSSGKKQQRRAVPFRTQARELGMTCLSDLAKEFGESGASLYSWFVQHREWVGEPWSESTFMWFTAMQVERFRELNRLLRVELYTHAGAKRQLRIAAERAKVAG